MTRPGEYTQSLIIVPDIQILGQSLNITENQFKELLLEGPKYGITPVFVGNYKDLMTNYSTLVTLHRQFGDTGVHGNAYQRPRNMFASRISQTKNLHVQTKAILLMQKVMNLYN